jgi:hypothetical protein
MLSKDKPGHSEKPQIGLRSILLNPFLRPRVDKTHIQRSLVDVRGRIFNCQLNSLEKVGGVIHKKVGHSK